MTSADSVWDALLARVSAEGDDPALAGLPDYRRAWFFSLIRQGREADAAGRAALAAHCRARAESELAALVSAASSAGAPAPDADVPGKAGASPLADLAARRGNASRARALEMLNRHGGSLTAAERTDFYAVLEGAVSDAAVSELRSRLVDRLLRAGRYRRQGARLAGWAAAKPAASPEDRPAGPYNDYAALEESLRRIAAIHPAWAAEFLDVYAGMRAVRVIYGELLPG
jgi:hypothetical protein